MITGINSDRTAQPGQPSHIRQSQPEYVDIYSRLNTFIENINQKIVNRIQLVQHTYLDEYKQHMKIMTKELSDIKGKIDEARIKERANEKMFLLEEQRDYFRYQVGKLDGQFRKVQLQVKSLKKSLVQANDQINNYKKICFKLEENASKLKSEVMEIYSLKQSDMARTAPTLVPQTSRQQRSQPRKAQTSMPRARSSSSKYQKTFRPIPNDMRMSRGLPNELQEILTECIKEMKKEIFYRNVKPEDINTKYFQEDIRIPFQRFSKSDRKQLLYRFLGNPEVLERFYNFVFDKNDDLKSTTANLVTIKPFDDKFNKSNLFMMRKKFEERIKSTKIRKDNFLIDTSDR